MTRGSTNQGLEAKRLRILVIAPSLDILGGQAVQAARLVSRLRELPSFEIGFLPINPRLPGAFRVLQSIKYLRTVVTSLLYFATLFARMPSYDVIHIFSASYFSFVLAQTPAILVAKLFRKRILLNYHSGEAEDHLTRWRTAVPTLRLVDEVVVPSPYLVKVFAKFGIEARAINNLIELDKFTFRERRPLLARFLSNRNLESHYGVDHVLRAFALIQKEIPGAELLVAGDGSQRRALEDLALALGLRNTKFVGRVEHDGIIEQYRRAHIYLNGSEIDNQPLSILEAFACGLPVITTDAGGIPDMVTNESTGFVVSRGDHEAMANRALDLLQGRKAATPLVQRAHDECQKYGWNAVRNQWIKLYRDLAKERTKRPAVTKRASSDRIGKLRKMNVAEIRERTSQAVAAFRERHGWSSLTTLPSDSGLSQLLHVQVSNARIFASGLNLLEHFRSRKGPAFFASFDQPDDVVAMLRKRWPAAEAQIIAEANRIVAGRFDLLGFKDLSFGNPIDWQLEPVSGKSTPAIHWSRLDYLNPEVAGDKKITWELNRHQHFLKLGQAYWLTKDEKYSKAFVTQLNSWMDQNPPKLGINWSSSLEVAFRSISWLWAFHYFKTSPALDSQTFTRAIKFLYLNARHLETYLSTYFSPNTHLTGEALGLFYLGMLLPEFKDSERWRETGKSILVEQLQRQVKADGVYFEQSSYYHRYTTGFYTHFLILARANQKRLSGVVEEKLAALLDHLMFITRPDGTTPLFGDDDGGRLLSLDRRPVNDFRAALATGAALFGRADYKFVAGKLSEETLWLLGPTGAHMFDEIKAEEPAAQSKEFPDGGYYVMRDGWHAKANYLLFDCGPHGTDNCGHAHADALAIELTVAGRPVLVDPGTLTYTGSQETRDLFRHSSAHNTLLVDGESSSLPAGPFSWKTIASCEPLNWISERRFDYVEGRHDGYERLSEPATHTRSILFLKNDYWLIRDRLSSVGRHNLALRFHCAPESKLESSDLRPQLSDASATAESGPQLLELSGESAGLQVAVFGPAEEKANRWSREASFVSQCYGSSEAAPVWTFSTKSLAKGDDPAELITLLLPNAGRGSGKFQVKEVEAIGGRAFEISAGDHCDLLMLRNSGSQRVETVRLVSDFNLSWARFSREFEGELLELLALDGQHIQLAGKEILNSTKRLQHLLASRVGERFRVETSEGLVDLRFHVGEVTDLPQESNRQSAIGN
ncbi:MAG TPA: heparinase II/III family protein [Pyrinomonadaceae bacterium]|jgi:glycosyltransferase involved in cell wall biosynthesis|nr:heparinase II/III family protein [Pyrinomonadaceae bacterium]